MCQKCSRFNSPACGFVRRSGKLGNPNLYLEDILSGISRVSQNTPKSCDRGEAQLGKWVPLSHDVGVFWVTLDVSHVKDS